MKFFDRIKPIAFAVLIGGNAFLLSYIFCTRIDTGTLLYMGSDPCEPWQDSPRQMLRMHETAFVGKDRNGHVMSVGVDSIPSADGIKSPRNFVVVKVGSEEAGLLDIHPAQEVALCHMADDLRIAIVARPMKMTGKDDRNLATVWVFDPEMGRFDDYLGVKRTDVKFVSNTPSMGNTADQYNTAEIPGGSIPQKWRT